MAAPWGLAGEELGGCFCSLVMGRLGTLHPPASWGLADLGSYLSAIFSCCLTLWEPLLPL